MKDYHYSFILLHGFTMDGKDMDYYKEKIKQIYPNVNIHFIAPNAPQIPISIYDNEKLNSWYDYYTPNCDKEPEINEEQLIKNRSKIHQLISKEIDYHKNDSERVFLVGMSQGCCMALDSGLTYPKRLGGIIGFKGHIINRTIKDLKEKQKVWVCHGRNDKTIYYQFAKETYNNLKKINPEFYLLTQNVNHSIPSAIINQMKSIQKSFTLT